MCVITVSNSRSPTSSRSGALFDIALSHWPTRGRASGRSKNKNCDPHYPSVDSFLRYVAVATGVYRSQLFSNSHAQGTPGSRTRLNVNDTRVDRLVNTPLT